MDILFHINDVKVPTCHLFSSANVEAGDEGK